MQCSEHHKTLTNGVGKCSVPIWCNGVPGGFCDKPAYGEPTEDGKRLYDGYVPFLACPIHGGPSSDFINRLTRKAKWPAMKFIVLLKLEADSEHLKKDAETDNHFKSKIRVYVSDVVGGAVALQERIRMLSLSIIAEMEPEGAIQTIASYPVIGIPPKIGTK